MRDPHPACSRPDDTSVLEPPRPPWVPFLFPGSCLPAPMCCCRGCPQREGWSTWGFLLPSVALNPWLTQEGKSGKPSPSPPAETTRRPDLSPAFLVGSGRSHAPRCFPATPQPRWVPSPFPCLLPTQPTHSLTSFSCEHKGPHLRICSGETQPKTDPV